MSHCRHAHHGSNSTADIWTKLAAVGEGTASIISDAFWLGSLLDFVAQLESDGFGLSWYGLSFGTLCALATAAGSVYSHSVLNITHQEGQHEHEHLPELINDDAGYLNTDTIINIPDDDLPKLIGSDSDIDEDHDHDHDHDHEHSHEHAQENNTSLTWLQRSALLGDYISHTGDIAGPIVFIAKIIDTALGDKMPKWGTALVQCGATLFGGVTSIANVRTCRNVMLELNQRQAHSHR